MPNVSENPNISTEHQPSGAAMQPSDTLDKPSATSSPPGGKTDVAEHIGPDNLPTPNARPAERDAISPPPGRHTDVAEDIGPGNMPDPNAPPANGLPPAGRAPGIAEESLPPAREVDPGFANNGE